ncbi:MAG: mandelate racemase/muconate lactonizing enzyme family protein [Candidatus Latescibacterota bacterium]|nr:mandelate racemase/muconate lactonizing enzyme family protein [Candidatus Latescibacterota bacterium]
MKITATKIYKFSVPTGQTLSDPHTGKLISSTSKTWLFFKIETDAGIDGWGEGSGEWLVPAVEATLKEWDVLLLDRDPLQYRELAEDIQNRLPWKGGPVFGTAIAAIDAALHDIAGKAWGVPVQALLGGKRRDKVRVYSNGGSFESPAAAASGARQTMELGFAGVKGNPLESRTWPMDAAAVEHSAACVEAMRREVGPDFDILLDTHGSPTPEMSVEFARRVAGCRPLFLEEPVKTGSVEALMEVSRKSPVPVASGEKLFTLEQFRPLIEQRACAYLQPDLTHCFGLTGLLDIARAAAAEQMLMAPHNAGGPLCTAATLQADALMGNFLIQETNHFWLSIYDRYVEHDWQVKDGHIALSDRPGLGVEVKEADIAELPYEPMAYRQYRHADGSWKGW